MKLTTLDVERWLNEQCKPHCRTRFSFSEILVAMKQRGFTWESGQLTFIMANLVTEGKVTREPSITYYNLKGSK